ncbi:hypothetical protein FJTKL_09766 [Diaporthe vaccinii]|uniref:t-SNARE coiled-coil homology domain-containing protein n=1 Tax=Diaporthe vaccinii TaxID=105482 RepID=A0ABR4EMR1_9PEZI
MSEAYERERQNNSRLDELSAKVSALRGVTIDIYDNARAQDVIDNTSDTFSTMRTQLTGSAGRLGRMAAAGNKVAILKLSAILIGTVLVLYYGWKLAAGQNWETERERESMQRKNTPRRALDEAWGQIPGVCRRRSVEGNAAGGVATRSNDS